MKFTQRLTALLALGALPALALAAGSHDAGPAKPDAGHGHNPATMHQPMHASPAGMAGDASKVTRTVKVVMDDNMRFEPGAIEVKAGETVRFFVINQGKLPHELVIGTTEELTSHAEEMRKMPQMKHQDPNMISLAPGKRGGIVWQFAKAGTFTYACLVPGHKEAGMVGTVKVLGAEAPA